MSFSWWHISEEDAKWGAIPIFQNAKDADDEGGKTGEAPISDAAPPSRSMFDPHPECIRNQHERMLKDMNNALNKLHRCRDRFNNLPKHIRELDSNIPEEVRSPSLCWYLGEEVECTQEAGIVSVMFEHLTEVREMMEKGNWSMAKDMLNELESFGESVIGETVRKMRSIDELERIALRDIEIRIQQGLRKKR